LKISSINNYPPTTNNATHNAFHYYIKGIWWIVIGIILLVHSCYATIRYRQYVTVKEQHLDGLPFDIIMECIVGCIICCWGIVIYAGDFQPLQTTIHIARRTWDMINHRQSFINFAHRGQALKAPHPKTH